jgi:type I restriction enzyme S subunit
MQVNRVSISEIKTSRLDPDYYKPEYLASEKAVQKFGSFKLGDAGKLFAGPFGSKLPSNLYQDQGIPLFRIGNIGNMEFVSQNMAHLALDVHQDIITSEVGAGDLLIVKASVSEKICKVPSNIDKANITQHIVALRSNGIYDTDYIMSFLFSRFGCHQLLRRSLGSIIQYLGISDTRTVSVPNINDETQAYIGDKVRQAELLRKWANILNIKIKSYFDNLLKDIPTKKVSKKHTRVSSDVLIPRINAEFYSENYRQVEKSLKQNFDSLVTIDDIAPVNKQKSRPNSQCTYFEIGDVDFSTGKLESGTFYELGEAPNNAQRKANFGDLLLSTRRPHRGAVAVVENVATDNYYSVFLVRLEPKCLEQSYWLKEYLRHDVGKALMLMRCTWTTYPVISEDDISTIPVPNVENDWAYVGGLASLKNKLHCLSDALSKLSQFLIESLIEGQITENQLIEAQQALNEGDDSKDRAILSKFTEQDYLAEDSKPVFTDLDKLYELLDQAQNASDDDSSESAEGLV